MSGMDEDTETLADVLRRLDGEGFNWSYLGSNDLNTDDGWRDVKDLARAVLASDWLAAHDAQVRAEALAPIAALVEAALEMNRPPHAVNSEVVWLVEDIRAAMEAKTQEDPTLPSDAYGIGPGGVPELKG